MIVSGAGAPRTGWIHRWGSNPRGVATALGLGSLAAIALALQGWTHELAQDRSDLYAKVRLGEDAAHHEAFLASTKEAMLRHPSEAYLPFIAAVEAGRGGRSVIPWIERTLTLAHVYGPAHFVLAQELERRGPAQARLEYRLAMTQEPLLRGPVLLRAGPLVGGFDDALELTPENARRIDVLGSLADAVGARLPATQARLDGMVRELDPNARGPLERTVGDALADLEQREAAPWCAERTQCAGPALAAVKHLSALQPGKCAPAILRAKIQSAAGDAATALHELQLEAQSAADPDECWHALGELALTARNEAYMVAAEDAIVRTGCGADAECVNNLTWAASLEERRGNQRNAMSLYAKAQKRAPERNDLVERVAQIASRLGLHAEALEAYRKLGRMNPETEKWRQLENSEKLQLFQETAP
jgi:hypothetical protein